MSKFNIPDEKKIRVIINTDAKNEVDDQFAIVHALLSESFDLKAAISAHFGSAKSPHSEKDSYEEVCRLLRLMDMEKDIRLLHGAENAIKNEHTPEASEGAEFIINEAMLDDKRPLYIAFLGPLTDMASALLIEPRIQERNITVIWIGGGEWPCGGREYNLSNDIAAANTVFKSCVKLWQIPRNVYSMMPVSFADLYVNVRPFGKIGEYLCDNVIEYNNADNKKPGEFRVLGDSPAIGTMLYDGCGEWEWRPAPEFDQHMHYLHSGKNRPIKVYKNIDSRFILNDFYAKLKLFN